MAVENLLGQTFNRLTAIGIAGRNKYGHLLWLWKCDCGAFMVALGTRVKTGRTKSCGCIDGRITHGMAHTRTYNSWKSMLSRCRNVNNSAYGYYGGNGVSVCERWVSFENFLLDMGICPDGLTLDRYPNKFGNYEPTNCRWATRKEQANNMRANRMFVLNGESLSATAWAVRLGIPLRVIRGRIRLSKTDPKWTDEHILTMPYTPYGLSRSHSMATQD